MSTPASMVGELDLLLRYLKSPVATPVQGSDYRLMLSPHGFNLCRQAR